MGAHRGAQETPLSTTALRKMLRARSLLTLYNTTNRGTLQFHISPQIAHNFSTQVLYQSVMTKKRSNKNHEATPESPTKKVKGGIKPAVGPDRQLLLLGKMLEYHMEGNNCISYERLRVDLSIGHRVKSWVGAWKALKEGDLIKPSDGQGDKGFQLTQQGLDRAETDEYREYLKDSKFVPKTNEEKQEKIKKRLKWQRLGTKIFDLLLTNAPLTAVELAAIVGVKRGTHGFSYAIKELKDRALVELDPTEISKTKKLRLTDACFLRPEDRPETSIFEDLEKRVKENANRKKSPIQKTAKVGISNIEAGATNEKKGMKDDEALAKIKIKDEPSTAQEKDKNGGNSKKGESEIHLRAIGRL